MPVANALHQFENQCFFGGCLHLSLALLVVGLTADPEPLARFLVTDFAALAGLLYDRLPKFFLMSMPSALLATVSVVCNM